LFVYFGHDLREDEEQDAWHEVHAPADVQTLMNGTHYISTHHPYDNGDKNKVLIRQKDTPSLGDNKWRNADQ